MNSNLIEETAWGVQVVYKATMELYENYFMALEAALKVAPESDVEKINRLNALIEEANEALQNDLAVFDKIIASDAEGLLNIQDELRIQSIYNKLQN